MFSPGQRVVISLVDPGYRYDGVIRELIGVQAVIHDQGSGGYDWELKLDRAHELVPGGCLYVRANEIVSEEGPW